MKQQIALPILTALSVITASCTSSQIAQMTNQIISDATGGVLKAPSQSSSSSSAQPTKIKLSKSSNSMNLYWKSGTPYADLGDESGYTQGSKTTGGYAFTPRQYKLLTITVDFARKTYRKEDVGLSINESGTVSFLQ